jgi:hypothetical protein
VVTWNGAILAQIGVTQPSVPPCATSLVDVSSSSQAYTPTHRTRGDANFWAGGGPFDGPHTVLVDTSIVPRNVGSAVVATITVHFQEEGGDQTTVDGTWTATLYQADPHVRIAAIVLGGQSYSDAFGHYEPTASVDLRPAGISYPVDLVTYRGFVGDNSAGTASATVRWRQLRLQLVGPPSGAATCSG